MSVRRHLGVFWLFVALVVLYSWPLMRNPVELPDNPDAHTMTWIMLAVFRNLFTQPTMLFQGNAIYPLGNTLTFTEPLVVPALVAGPVFALTGNPALAHKIALVLLWALSGWATYAVAFWLTGRHAAGLVAALIFTLSLPRLQYAGEFQMELTFGIPLGIYTLVRFLESQRIRYLVAFLVVFWLQAISVWYVTVILALGLVVVALQYGALRWTGWRGRTLLAAALGGVALAVAMAPIAWPYLVTHRDVGFERVAKDVDVTRYADVFTYLRTRGTWFGPLRDIESGETSLFVGVVALLLTVLSVFWLRPRASRSRAERLLTAAVPGGLAVVLLAAASGPRLHLGASVFSAAGAAVLLIALARQGCEGWQRRRDGLTDRQLSERDWVGLLLVLAGFAFFLSLGPVVHVHNHLRGSGFYTWLYPYVFPLHVIRTTSRFGLVVAFAVALLAGFGVSWLLAHVPPRKARAVAVGVVALLLVEYARFPLSLAMAPVTPRPVDRLLRADPEDVAVLEWPMDPAIDGNAMLRSVFHGHRVVNAWAGFVPGFTHKLSKFLTLEGPPFPTPDAQTALRQIYPLRYLVVRRAELTGPSRPTWEALRREAPTLLRFRGVVGDVDLYQLEPLPEQGARLSRLVSYSFLRAHPHLRVTVRPVDRDPGLDQWIDVELNGRPVERIPMNEDATGSATLSPPFLPVMPNEITLTHRYRDRAMSFATDARYHVGRTGRWLPRDLSVHSAGLPYGDVASIRLDGVELARNRRGYNLLALDPEGKPLAAALFDTFALAGASHELAAWIGALPPGTVVAGAVKAEASGALSDEAVAALRDLGVNGDIRGQLYGSHAFVGVKGAPAGTALEALGHKAVTVTVGDPARAHGFQLTDFRLEDDVRDDHTTVRSRTVPSAAIPAESRRASRAAPVDGRDPHDRPRG